MGKEKLFITNTAIFHEKQKRCNGCWLGRLTPPSNHDHSHNPKPTGAGEVQDRILHNNLIENTSTE